MRHAFLSAACIALAAVSGPVTAGAAEKLWEADGFAGPECAFPDASLGVVFVTNVNGDPTGKDGNGTISRLSLDGTSVQHGWATGLNAPKGIARSGDRLFVGDIDELVEIDVNTGAIVARHAAPGAKLLNDVAADAAGNIYSSDTMGGRIYRLSGGTIDVWLERDKLDGPNGLLVEGDNLIVNTWGVFSGEGWATTTPGHVLSVSLADKAITPLDGGKPIGNLDGLQLLAGGDYLMTDWMAGKVLRFDPKTGTAKELLDLGQGSADLGYHAESKTAFIPMMLDGKLVAYRID